MQRLTNTLIAALMLVAFGLIAAVPVTRADEFVIWCWNDPQVELNGQIFDIELGVLGQPSVVRRGVRLAETTLFIPQGMRARVLSTTNIYFEERVRIVELPVQAWGNQDQSGRTGGEVRVVTRFEASVTLPAAMAVNRALRDTGTTRGLLTTSITVR